jgi:signal transduction histidine kinase
MSAAPFTATDLRGIDLFDDLGDAELERWAAHAELRELAPGEVLAEPGEQLQAFYLLLSGTVQAVLLRDGRPEPVTRHVAPTWIGAIPLLTETAIPVRLQADEAARIAAIPAAEFVELALTERPVHARIMRQIRPVVGRIAAIEQNRERLASLGTMAAGLAHELNNPAAAARRAADDLTAALDVLASTVGHFVESGIEREQAQQLVELQREALASAASCTRLDALDAADAEDELLEALGALEIPEPWRLTEPLAAAGVDRGWLDRVAALAGPATNAAVAWVAASLTARGLAAELGDSTDRISRLVGAVKAYAYMDRGAMVEVDLHEGLETTLVVLGYKLKHTAIEVERRYDRSLPKLTVRGPELNQVWTNLLDNAIDALGKQGTITIATGRDGPGAVVEVADDGPGIPAEVRDRVFDPFFTTKAVGAGTGLGLDTARRIVTEGHHGTLRVESEPGRTAFRVWLPFDQRD